MPLGMWSVKARKGNSIKGELNMASNENIVSCLVQSDAIGINAGGLDGISVIVTYNITGQKNPLTRKEIINIIGADNILNDLRAEYKRNGREMPDATIDDVDSFFTEDNNRIIAEFTFDDYFDYE